jgi:hypothetical protein
MLYEVAPSDVSARDMLLSVLAAAARADAPTWAEIFVAVLKDDDSRPISYTSDNRRLRFQRRSSHQRGLRRHGAPRRDTEPIRNFDLDFQRRYRTSAVHLDLNLVGFEGDVPADHVEDFLAQNAEQVRLIARVAFVREQYL